MRPGMSVEEVIRRWVENDEKAYDDSMPQMFPVRDLSRYKEYRWTRDNSRSGYAQVGGKSVWLEGPMKWDALMEDMKLRGWDPDEPLHLHVGRKGGVKVGEGNHRLAIAESLGMRKVPVRFHFYDGKVRKSPPPEQQVEVSPKL